MLFSSSGCKELFGLQKEPFRTQQRKTKSRAVFCCSIHWGLWLLSISAFALKFTMSFSHWHQQTTMWLHQQMCSTNQSFWASKALEYLLWPRTLFWHFTTLSQVSFTALSLQELLRGHVHVYWGTLPWQDVQRFVTNIFVMMNNGAWTCSCSAAANRPGFSSYPLSACGRFSALPHYFPSSRSKIFGRIGNIYALMVQTNFLNSVVIALKYRFIIHLIINHCNSFIWICFLGFIGLLGLNIFFTIFYSMKYVTCEGMLLKTEIEIFRDI